MMDKVLVFYNPNAGNGVFGTNLDRVVSAFQKEDMLVVPLRADRRGILDVFFASTDMSTYKKIVVAGGDGTINAMVSAMVKYDIYLPIAIFPSGTANDLAHYFDLPADIDELLAIATGDCYTTMDVGTVNGRCFVNVLAMGMIVDVSQKTDPGIKEAIGIMAYYMRAIAEVPKLKPIPITITYDGHSDSLNMYAMLVMNGRSAGGFKRVAPQSDIGDGLLDVLVIKDTSVINLVPLLLSLLAGEHLSSKHVLHFQTSELLIESDVDVNTDVDGEVGEKLPLHIKMLDRRLQVNTLEDEMCGNVW